MSSNVEDLIFAVVEVMEMVVVVMGCQSFLCRQ